MKIKLGDYEVIVGNVGSVYVGSSEREAMLTFNCYMDHSKSNYGRCAGENVTLMFRGDIAKEYVGTLEQEKDGEL